MASTQLLSYGNKAFSVLSYECYISISQIANRYHPMRCLAFQSMKKKKRLPLPLRSHSTLFLPWVKPVLGWI